MNLKIHIMKLKRGLVLYSFYLFPRNGVKRWRVWNVTTQGNQFGKHDLISTLLLMLYSTLVAWRLLYTVYVYVELLLSDFCVYKSHDCMLIL